VLSPGQKQSLGLLANITLEVVPFRAYAPFQALGPFLNESWKTFYLQSGKENWGGGMSHVFWSKIPW
jgi:hypothetical protein